MLLSASSAAFGFGGWTGLESMANGSADHIKELRGTSPDSATHTTATPKVPTHTGNAQPVKPVSPR